MDMETTSIDGLIVLSPKRFDDNRGHFIETYQKRAFEDLAGVSVDFVQDNFSFSKHANTVRGLHFQKPPHAQGKLVRCPQGCLLDVAVDIRESSQTYGQWFSVELSAENNRQLWIPAGFLHGFRTLEANTAIAYKCTDYYAPDCDATILWNDPMLNIDWGTSLKSVTLSGKDERAQDFKSFKTPF